MKTVKYFFSSYVDLARQWVQRHIYMRKLHFAIATARKFHKETKRKYYIVNDVAGNPIFITAVQLNEFKAKKVIPLEWTHLDMERNSIHVIPDNNGSK